MSTNILDSFKNLFKGKQEVTELEEGMLRVNVVEMERYYEEEDLVTASIVLRELLEVYASQKKQNHRYKGREFIHFILSNKHKDLKTVGYTHWQNINKIIHLNHTKVYPYHKENLKSAMDFFQKEVKSLKAIDMKIEI